MTDERESLLHPDNLPVLEELYDRYLVDPESVGSEWRGFFQGLDLADNSPAVSLPKLTKTERSSITEFPVRVMMLVNAYRRHGHFNALTDPLGLRVPEREALHMEDYGLSQSDFDRQVTTVVAGKPVTMALGDLVDLMEKTYCSSIGVEFFYIRDEGRRNWLMQRMEIDPEKAGALDEETRLRIFEKLYSGEFFEKFLAARFPGKKRFSLEGAESLIPALSTALDAAGEYQIRQMVIGMAHRGRLNVLANIMGKDPALIFAEFNESVTENTSDGDVKYHLGFSNDIQTPSGHQVHLSLGFNPSHLEVINPVVMGSVRARQTRAGDIARDKHLAVLIHGDAAFAGQGINYECINMTDLAGYSIGGTFHVVVNNQIGFTTNPSDSRSTPYATDLAKLLMVPIFHVNADDPEACYRAVRLCMEWRQTYHTDAFIDLICYRRWGHNETDEPAFTQPLMYARIKEHPTPAQLYELQLAKAGIAQDKLDAVRKKVEDHFEGAYKRVQSDSIRVQFETLAGNWTGFRREDPHSNPETGISSETLRLIADGVTTVPPDFHPNSKVARLLAERRSMAAIDSGRIDWGMGEMLLLGSLLLEGYNIRFSGQDVKRGTFSHRHAALIDAQTGREFVPLASLKEGQGTLEMVNSLLSEEAALGFEFGYSLAEPRTLVLWEAQFGDFANGAQVIIDQFISSCEAKWHRMSGLVMLLPHGYEGQGPEHSSARLERYLQLCSQNNIQVCNCSTPAQLFHLIRRQMHRNFRKPLVIMSPKSLLRLPAATSNPANFLSGSFLPVIDETNPEITPERVERVVFCSGKIYYELLQAREAAGLKNIAIVRLEQYYPYPFLPMADIVQKYESAHDVCWVQEEPRNQGAWLAVEHYVAAQLGPHQELRYLGRVASPSPATGYHKVHTREQEEIIRTAMRVTQRARKEVLHGS